MSTEKTPQPGQPLADSLFGALDDLSDLAQDIESSLPLSPGDLSPASTDDLAHDPDLRAALDEAVLGIEEEQTRFTVSNVQEPSPAPPHPLAEDLALSPLAALVSAVTLQERAAFPGVDEVATVVADTSSLASPPDRAPSTSASPQPASARESPPPPRAPSLDLPPPPPDLDAPRAPGASQKPADEPLKALFDIDRMFGSSDLIAEDVEPLGTGDFGQRSVAGAESSADSKSHAGSDDLMVVGRILGGNVDIVVDVSTLLDGESSGVSEGVEEQVSFAQDEQSYDPSEDLTVMRGDETAAAVDPAASRIGRASDDHGPPDSRTGRAAKPERSPSTSSVPTVPTEFGMPLAILGTKNVDAYLKKPGFSEDAQDLQDPAGERAARHEAFEDFNSGQYLYAKKKFERLSKAHKQNSDYAALASYCRFKLAQGEAERLGELSKLAEYAKEYSACVTTRLYMGRMFMEMERPQSAVRYFKEALDIDSSRSDVVVELRRANDFLQVLKAGKDVDPLAVEMPERPARVRGASIIRKQVDVARIPQAVLVFGLVSGLLFYLSNVMALGRDEHSFLPADPFFWARGGILIVSGLLFARIFLRSEPLSGEDFQIPIRTLVASVIVGCLIGANMPLAIIKVPLLTVLFMSLLQVISEEVFFRGFIGRALEAGLLGIGTPTVVGGLLFGLYQLTYYAPWSQVSTTEGLLKLALVTFAAGVPYAFLHHRSKTLAIPFACHLTVNTVVMFASVY